VVRIIEPSQRKVLNRKCKNAKLRSGVKWQGTFKHKRVQETDVKQGLGVIVISNGNATSRERYVMIIVAQSKA